MINSNKRCVKSTRRQLRMIYEKLMLRYGPQHWWPADSPFEVIIGAILTQSAAWRNVEKAINNMKSSDALTIKKLRNMPLQDLAKLIRPSGYYNAKAKKLKAFISWLNENCDNDLEVLFNKDINDLREKLLSIHGIGEETADSIILYAAEKPIFVIDAYTKRIISRIGLLPVDAGYNTFQRFFMEKLKPEVYMFNEYHALLVCLGKQICRKNPLCKECCLQGMCQNHLKSQIILTGDRDYC
jgi:endonuclease III related protein